VKKCTIKRKVDKTIIIYKLTGQDQISSSELGSLQKSSISELLPVTIKKGLFGTKLQYEARDCLQLSRRLEQGLEFSDFCAIVRNSIDAFKRIGKSFRLNGLELETDKVFCNFATGKVQFIYWPLVSENHYSNIGEYFKSIGEQYVCDENSGSSKGKAEYLSLFKQMYTFNLAHFEQNFLRMTSKWMSSDQSMQDGSYADYSRNEEAPSFPSHQNEFDEGNTERTVSIWDEKGEDNREDLTVDDESCVEQTFNSTKNAPILRRMSTGEIGHVLGSPFVLGRSKQRADMVISGNAKIGNYHAVITKRNGHYYLEDADSRNGTFMNGERLEPHQPVELYNHAEFRLFDEQFFFECQREESTWNH
jgi:hypothetical protein